MARPFSVAAANGAPSTIFQPNLHVAPFSVAIGCVVTSGSPTFKVEHTYDDPNEAGAVWFDHPSIVGKTANADGVYGAPVRGMRLSVTAGTGQVRGVFIQAGIAG